MLLFTLCYVVQTASYHTLSSVRRSGRDCVNQRIRHSAGHTLLRLCLMNVITISNTKASIRKDPF
jgi:hypothetical protein